MAWRKGLCRLWVVVSVAWVLCVIVGSISDAVHIANLPTADDFFGCNVTPRPASCGPLKPYAEQWAYFLGYWFAFALKWVLVAIFPPAILFGAGRVGIWVGEGFRH